MRFFQFTVCRLGPAPAVMFTPRRHYRALSPAGAGACEAHHRDAAVRHRDRSSQVCRIGIHIIEIWILFLVYEGLMILAQFAHTRMHGGQVRHRPGVFRDFMDLGRRTGGPVRTGTAPCGRSSGQPAFTNPPGTDSVARRAPERGGSWTPRHRAADAERACEASGSSRRACEASGSSSVSAPAAGMW